MNRAGIPSIVGIITVFGVFETTYSIVLAIVLKVQIKILIYMLQADIKSVKPNLTFCEQNHISLINYIIFIYVI